MESVLRAIWQQFGKSREITFEDFSQHATFHNEEGNVVVFSPDSFPSGLRLYLQFNITVSKKVPFQWDRDQNQKLRSPYIISENGLEASTRSDGEGMWVLTSDTPLLAGTGTYKFKIVFSHSITYQFVGLINSAERFKTQTLDMGNDFRQFPLVDSNDLKTEFEIDTDRRVCKRKNIHQSAFKVTENLPDQIWIGATMKQPHHCKVTIEFSD